MTTEQIITKLNIKQEYRTICNDRKIYLCKCHLCIIAFHMATDIKLATFVFGSNNYKLTKMVHCMSCVISLFQPNSNVIKWVWFSLLLCTRNFFSKKNCVLESWRITVLWPGISARTQYSHEHRPWYCCVEDGFFIIKFISLLRFLCWILYLFFLGLKGLIVIVVVEVTNS